MQMQSSGYNYDPSEDKKRRNEINSKMESKVRKILKTIDYHFYRIKYRRNPEPKHQ